ncbi:hypothetical protein A2276_08515 [candidate division WOR-1 bacterium RIFOXYA12_FULL_43_27]|uniref:Uncharacterized protein n=1 Tax=candidate division WOR-1 bacterium RIFOXYC2_FULL_46_14 TaxID=1802587 RepID=A0A1F4U679_UNCSA|nr:MAG: hypothetical protein A2276_08515 [candidate division WOR-1 bacterium RIFOXYA12_FULL_43_27]OGC20634.1 MAG: hypothetical protein A2292_06340 [candidate division WOR-1 bacterium RIFOXYB2_FULL_46_45]OGC31629.1 MAG: hypothetical protein A2232_05110 [candidate division WOR-1 bacterium RIFOXYA2_FULL_46_56]OGC40475.1 MAG: hypothetical protein A2438_04370 [candidate division WOR-1 bacterium RIFOXYC2_FULL_46_14]
MPVFPVSGNWQTVKGSVSSHAQMVLTATSLNSLAFFARPGLAARLLRDENLSEVVGQISIGISRITRSNQAGNDFNRIAVRAMTIAVAAFCRELSVNHRIETYFYETGDQLHCCGIENYSPRLIALAGEEGLIGLLIMLSVFKSELKNIGSPPRGFYIEDFIGVSRRILKEESPLGLSRACLGEKIRAIGLELKNVEGEYLKQKSNRQALLERLINSSERESFSQITRALIPAGQAREQAEQLQSSLLDRFVEEVLPQLRGAVTVLVDEILKLASAEEGARKLGFSSISEAAAIPYENLALISILDQWAGVPDKLGKMTFWGLKKGGGFSRESGDLFRQLAIAVTTDSEMYRMVLSFAHWEAVQLLKRCAQQTTKQRNFVKAGKTAFLIIGLDRLLGLSQERGEVVPFFDNKVFYYGINGREMDIREIVGLCGLAEKVPEMLLCEDPMFCHVFFNERGVIFYEDGSQKTEIVPYSAEAREIILERLREISSLKVADMRTKKIPDQITFEIVARLRMREDREKNPGKVTEIGKKRKQIKEKYGIELDLNLDALFTLSELKFFDDFFGFYPAHMLRGIEMLIKNQRRRTGYQDKDVYDVVSLFKKNRETMSPFIHFDGEKKALSLDYWGIQILNSGDPVLIYDALPLFHDAMGRIIWHYFLSDARRAAYPVQDPAQFSTSLFFYLRKRQEGEFLADTPEDRFFFGLVNPRLLAG